MQRRRKKTFFFFVSNTGYLNFLSHIHFVQCWNLKHKALNFLSFLSLIFFLYLNTPVSHDCCFAQILVSLNSVRPRRGQRKMISSSYDKWLYDLLRQRGNSSKRESFILHDACPTFLNMKFD